MQILVQTLLNSSTYVQVTVNSTDTIASVKTAVQTATGLQATWFELYKDVVLDTSKTLAFYNIVDGDSVLVHNNIPHFTNKADRQLAKLQLAQIRRYAGGDDTKAYYRYWNGFNILTLPLPYGYTDNQTIEPLQPHRPWVDHS